MPTTAFNRADDRHYKTTGPLGFIEGFDLDGKRFEWSVKSGNTFKLRVVNDTDRDGSIESTDSISQAKNGRLPSADPESRKV